MSHIDRAQRSQACVPLAVLSISGAIGGGEAQGDSIIGSRQASVKVAADFPWVRVWGNPVSPSPHPVGGSGRATPSQEQSYVHPVGVRREPHRGLMQRPPPAVGSGQLRRRTPWSLRPAPRRCIGPVRTYERLAKPQRSCYCFGPHREVRRPGVRMELGRLPEAEWRGPGYTLVIPINSEERGLRR